MSDFGKLGISGNLEMSIFQWHKSRIILSSGCEIASFGIRAAGVISLLTDRFPVLILDNLGMLLTR